MTPGFWLAYVGVTDQERQKIEKKGKVQPISRLPGKYSPAVLAAAAFTLR